jgi:hypothetical protein
VTAADGSLGGFSGGLHIKRRLHALEAISCFSVSGTSSAAKD